MPNVAGQPLAVVPFFLSSFQDVGDVVVYAAFVLLPLISARLLLLLARYSRRDPQRRKGLVVGCANVLVLVFLLSLAILGLESYYRFWCDTTDWHAVNRVSARWLARHYQMNRSGFRDNVADYPMQRTDGKRRITFLGDSFTAGFGIANVDDRFANLIRTRKPEWEIQVMGVDGFDTGDELATVQAALKIGYQFDEVVLVYCLNDITDIVPEWQAAHVRIYRRGNLGFLCTHSFCFNAWYFDLLARFDPDIARYGRLILDAYNGPLWSKQQERLTTFRNLIQGSGAHLRVVTFPLFQKLGPGYEYVSIHKKLEDFWRESGVPHLDLLGLYESHAQMKLIVNSHDTHPNERAHALAADAILAFLDQDPWLH